MTTADNELQERIERELAWDPEVTADHVGVTVKDGVVGLNGFVPTYAERMATERAALRVQGTRAVANDLAVKLSTQRIDPDIATAAANALRHNLSVPASVKVTVRDGYLTLEGTCEWWFQRNAAEQTVRYMPGVKGVTNSEGASAGWGRTEVAIAASNGFVRAYQSSGSSLSVSVLAGDATQGMETDYDYSSAVYFSDLTDPVQLGRNAGERAVRRLNPRKVQTEKVPIVFDPRVSSSMVGHLLGAINGASIARGTSFLKEKMGEQVFAAGIDIVEDPHRPRGLRSMPFDGEGLATRRNVLVEDGVLRTFVHNAYTARRAGTVSTANAVRGFSSTPAVGCRALSLVPGTKAQPELLAEVGDGVLISSVSGLHSGVNPVSGDFSTGAEGLRITGGELGEPLREFTIASSIQRMLAEVAAVGSDIEWLPMRASGVSLVVRGVTVSGS